MTEVTVEKFDKERTKKVVVKSKRKEGVEVHQGTGVYLEDYKVKIIMIQLR